MARSIENPRSSKNVSSADFGAPAQWAEHILVHPLRGETPGKVFLGKVLGLEGMEVSLGSMPPGASVPFLHAHRQNEELYVFLGGEGEFQVDGGIIPVQAGSAVRVAPAGLRCWRATGSEPLTYLVVQAKAGSLEQATGMDGLIPDKAVAW